jgi:periplasmic protein TonB
MAYVDNSPSNKRLVGLGVAIVVHVLLGYVVVSGLAPKIIATITGPIEVKDIEEEVQKEEEPPPPPPEKLVELPPFVPPPVIDIALPPPPPAPTINTQSVIQQPTPPPVVAPRGEPVAPPPPAPPAPPAEVRVPVDRAALSKILSRKQRPDFPPSVVRAMEAAGVNKVAVNCEATVGAEGRITDVACESTGYERLDELMRRFFVGTRIPAATVDGKPVATKVAVPRFVWQLEDGR